MAFSSRHQTASASSERNKTCPARNFTISEVLGRRFGNYLRAVRACYFIDPKVSAFTPNFPDLARTFLRLHGQVALDKPMTSLAWAAPAAGKADIARIAGLPMAFSRFRVGCGGRRQGGQSRRRTGLRTYAEFASALHLQTCQQFDIAELHPGRRGAIALVSRGVSPPVMPKLIPRRRLVADAASHRARTILGQRVDPGAFADLIDIGLRN